MYFSLSHYLHLSMCVCVCASMCVSVDLCVCTFSVFLDPNFVLCATVSRYLNFIYVRGCMNASCAHEGEHAGMHNTISMRLQKDLDYWTWNVSEQRALGQIKKISIVAAVLIIFLYIFFFTFSVPVSFVLILVCKRFRSFFTWNPLFCHFTGFCFIFYFSTFIFRLASERKKNHIITSITFTPVTQTNIND